MEAKDSSLVSAAIAAIAQRGAADAIHWSFQNPIGQNPAQVQCPPCFKQEIGHLRDALRTFPVWKIQFFFLFETTAPISLTFNPIQTFKYSEHLNS